MTVKLFQYKTMLRKVRHFGKQTDNQYIKAQSDDIAKNYGNKKSPISR